MREIAYVGGRLGNALPNVTKVGMAYSEPLWPRPELVGLATNGRLTWDSPEGMEVLAASILADVLGDDRAAENAALDFAEQVLDDLPNGDWRITAEAVWDWWLSGCNAVRQHALSVEAEGGEL